jgi:hypothetical protein
MNDEMEKIYATLSLREIEINNLRQGYMITSKRYDEALKSLRMLTVNTARVANLAGIAADKSLLASKKAAVAANEAIATVTVTAAASAAVEAAVEAASAATAASKAAEQAADAVVKTVSRHTELAALEAAKEARAASERASAAATEAAKIADNATSVLATKQCNKKASS